MIKYINSLFKIFLELCIFDKRLRANLKADFTKMYLKKYINYGTNLKKELKEYTGKDTIWQYWHQGIEAAPDLIKQCFRSVRHYMPDKKQVIITFDTIKDYIELPEIYYRLLENKKMKIAHFSDVLRVYLLEKYGGTWVDSTIFLTDRIPDDIMNSNFCILQKDIKTDVSKNNNSCFFIHSKEYSYHIEALKNILDKYWQDNDYLINYFMFEHISTMLSEIEGELKIEWDSMPRYSAEITGELQKHLFEDFQSQNWEEFKKKTSIHKLSYKIIRNKTSGKSYYDYIMSLDSGK